MFGLFAVLFYMKLCVTAQWMVGELLQAIGNFMMQFTFVPRQQ